MKALAVAAEESTIWSNILPCNPSGLWLFRPQGGAQSTCEGHLEKPVLWRLSMATTSSLFMSCNSASFPV
jgi:hypothetical protein